MSTVPTGTVTFLFTDIEGSTNLAQEHRDTWETMRGRHHAILHQAMQAHDGYVFQIVGDEFCVAFHTALDAVHAAAEAQRMLYAEPWKPAPIKVRMGIHTGTAQVGDTTDRSGGYTGYTALARVARLMSAGNGGQVLVSLATEELIRDELPDDISLRDMGPRRLKDLIRPEQIFQLIIPGLPVDFPPLKTLDAYRHNLPIQLTSFIGREKELAEIRQALMEHRLVTLTGAGGTGKTRLSLHVAADLLDQFPNGVWFVELASLTNPELIPQTILSAFGIGDQPGLTSLQLLGDYLHEKHLLLVLDNCEHLIAETAKLVTSLLTSTENLKILATSREALGVEGEVNWYVPSLSLPDIQHLPPTDALSQYEAVRLFIDRAILAQPHFTVTKDNAPAIAQICYRLDGIPLAIELAAARVKVLDVEQINKRLDDRFSLLTGGVRTALPRHQTLRATIDWSYELLSEQEKILFRRLAVFAGGWTVEAAEQICGMEESELNVLDLLAHLVNKSLVVMDNSAGEARYHMLETTRQYTAEKLLASGEEKRIRDYHCDWYQKLVERGYKELQGPNQLPWRHRLDREVDNLRAALEWSFGTGMSFTTGIQIVSCLADYWSSGGFNRSEMLFWLQKAVGQSQTLKGTPVRAKTLYLYGRWLGGDNWKDGRTLLEESLETYRNLGEDYRVDRAYTLASLGSYFYFQDNDYDTGRAYMQEAIHIFEDAGDKRGKGWALNLFFGMELNEGNPETALAMAEEGVELYRSCGDRFGTAICIDDVGIVNLRLGNYEKAKKYLEESVEVHRESGKKGFLVETLNAIGEAYRGLDEYAKAETFYRESFATSQGFYPASKVVMINLNLGYTVLYRGDDKQAASFFNEALRLSKEWDDKEDLVLCVAGFAAVAVVQEDAEASALLYGAVDSQVQILLSEGMKLNALFPPTDRRELDRYQSLCRAKLGNSTFESVFERGRTLTLDAAIALALEQVVNQ